MAPRTLPELVDLWITDLVASDRSSNTVRLYATAVRQFLSWSQEQEGRALSVDDLTPIALLGYRNELQHRRARASRTINAHVAALRGWCKWLEVSGHLVNNPAQRLKFIGLQEKVSDGLNGTQINALLREAARTPHPTRDYAIVQMLLQTGMRIGECAALNFEDITFGERSGSVTIRAGKGNKTRTVPLNGSARKALADYVAPTLEVAPTLLAVATAWPKRRSSRIPIPLWRSQKQDRLSTDGMRRMIDNLVREAAMHGRLPPTTSAHTLRHTFARHYLQDNPGDVIGLASLLGHDSLDTTRIYAQPSADQLAARVERLNLNAFTE